MWRLIVPPLAERYETLAVDLPGHGRSGPIPAGASIEWFADEVAGLLGNSALARPILVGLSMGGGIAQYVAIRNPGLLAALVLVSTSPVHPEATRQRFLDRAARAEEEGMDAIVDITVPRWFTPSFAAARPDDVAATEATVRATDPVQFARASRANAARDCTAGLASIDCPVLFMGGLEDPADPLRSVPIYEREVRDLTIELRAEASHLLPVESPGWVTETLGRFIGRIEGGSA